MIIQKAYGESEDKESFNKTHWFLLADVIERLADLEVQRENIKEAEVLFDELI